MLANSAVSSAQVAGTEPLVEELDVIELAIAEEKKACSERYQKMRAETDTDKRKQMYFAGIKDAKVSFKRVFEAVKKQPSSPSALAGLNWSFQGLEKDDQIEAFEIVKKHHKEDVGIIKILSLAFYKKLIDEAGLRELIQSTQTETTRQAFTFTLAELIDSPEQQSKKSLALYKELENWPNIAETNPDLLNLVKQYLFVAEHLSVGQEAPEIIGTDHEDKEFKLSDYRGKVVLLDFWGIW